jgi:hypothetical protein
MPYFESLFWYFLTDRRLFWSYLLNFFNVIYVKKFIRIGDKINPQLSKIEKIDRYCVIYVGDLIPLIYLKGKISKH